MPEENVNAGQQTAQSKSLFEGLDIEFQNGDWVITGEKSQEEEQKETTDTTTTEIDTEATNPSPSPSNPLDAKVTALEAQLSQVTALLTNIVNNKNSSPQEKEKTLQDQIGEAENTTQVFEILQNNIQKNLDKRLQTIESGLQQMNIQFEFNRLAATYGQDFISKAEAIGQLMQSAPGLSMDNAYKALAKVTPITQVKKELSRSNPKELVSKSKTLQLDSTNSVNDTTVNTKREIKSIADAVDVAYEQLVG